MEIRGMSSIGNEVFRGTEIQFQVMKLSRHDIFATTEKRVLFL